MLSKRLIVCLDVDRGEVVKGTAFKSLRVVGDPCDLAIKYETDGADEIVFLDISASAEARATVLDVARRTAERLFIPLTIGGGVRSCEDISHTLGSGADKVSINSAAVENPGLIDESARRFGAQCIVASIDAKIEANCWRVYTRGGRNRTELDALEWAHECVERGAGEILLTSIDHDGTRRGYDVGLTRAVSQSVSVPVIASGGAGSGRDVVEVLTTGEADAALVAGILHDGTTTVAMLKSDMATAGVSIRAVT